jgi:hypothetical protein
MKTKNYKLTIDLPTTEAITAGLDPTQDEGYVTAQERTSSARRQLEAANQRLVDAGKTLDRMRGAIADGRASIADLERAQQAQRTAALVIEQYRQRVREAETGEAAALERATQSVRADGEQRLALLKRAAAAIAPLLDIIKACELALDTKVPNLPALEWPASAAVVAASRMMKAPAPPPLNWR